MYTGESVPMPDASDRVTGQVPFLVNFELPDMLHGKVLRSPYAHARVVSVDTKAAENIPGVIGVLSKNDFIGSSPLDAFYGSVLKDHQVVGMEKVRFVGEPVAAVAAVNLEIAEEALDVINVEYEELPAVFDVKEAIRVDAPLVHEGALKAYPGHTGMAMCPVENSNIFHEVGLRHGDVEEGFGEADEVFCHTFYTPAVHHAALEPHVAVARIDEGRLTLWSATQAPYKVRNRIAGVLGMVPDDVRVIAMPVGGGFGAKSHIKIEGLAACLSWKASGLPVKLMLTRAETFVQITKHAAEITLKTGIKQDGTLVARQAEIYWNAGAYSDTSPIVAKNGAVTCFGPYRIPHALSKSYAVYTNSPPAGSYRGPAVLEVTWAGESQMDIISKAIGMDPLEFRKKNILVDGDIFVTGETMHDLHYAALMASAANKIGWEEAGEEDNDSKTGFGVALTIKSTTTPSTSKALVRLETSGLCSLLVSTVDLGQGSSVALSQIAADALCIPIQQIRVVNPDTDVTPFDAATNSSRSTYSMGTALRLAAGKLKGRLMQIASEVFNVGVDELVLDNGIISLRADANRSISWPELMRRFEVVELEESAKYTTEGGLSPDTLQGVGSVHWHQGVGAAIVNVDKQTGFVRVKKFHAATYAGCVVNPNMASLQTEGNAIMGLGVALSEELVYDDGQIVNANLGDYLIPSFVDVPDGLSIFHLEGESDEKTIHGIAESTIPTVAPAVANAIDNAAGIRAYDLPITPEKVLRQIVGVETS